MVGLLPVFKNATQYESAQGRVNWRYLPATNEVIWYSERDNWGQLYLYDATTGKLKNQITTGEHCEQLHDPAALGLFCALSDGC